MTTKRNNKGVTRRVMMLTLGTLLVLAAAAGYGVDRAVDAPEEVSLAQLLRDIEAGDATDVLIVEGGGLSATVDGVDQIAPLPITTTDEVFVRLLDAGIDFETGAQPRDPVDDIALFVTLLIPLGVVGVLVWWIVQRRQGRGLATSRFAEAEQPDVRLDDVIGAYEAVVEAREVVDWLKDPDGYDALGAKPPSGVLMVGPPGIGKTLLAKAIAGETGVPFFAVSGSDFVELFAGLGTRRVKTLFDNARKAAAKHGAAIVFIDELDAVGRKRGPSVSSGGQQEAEQTLNALLVQLDGFEARDRIVVFGATNRPDVLDSAITRPGRFDRQITLGLPDYDARCKLLIHALDRLPAPTDVDVERHAKKLPGASGADLVNVVNIAAIVAARQRATEITDTHIDAAITRVLAGTPRESAVVHPDDRHVTAVHEAGHAVVGWALPDAPPPSKVSIIPHGGSAGGVTMSEGYDRSLITRAGATARLAVLMAGRAAENTVLGDDHVTNGAASDLKQATTLARQMITEWGWSDLGLAYLAEVSDNAPTGDVIADHIDGLLQHALDTATTVIREHRSLFDGVVAALQSRSELSGEELASMAASLHVVRPAALESGGDR